jgi:hypothetical protein
MATVDISRRLPTRSILNDIESMQGLQAVENYATGRAEATPEALTAALKKMQSRQEKETEMMALAKAASDDARQAEWEFHNGVMAMKESVRGMFGSDSNEAQSVGYKKKSERKRPRRRTA